MSATKLKRFYVIYNNKVINFGSKVGQTFIDHGDKIDKEKMESETYKDIKEWQARIFE